MQRIIRSRVLQHTVFWFISLFALTYALRVSASPGRIDVIYAIIFHIPIAIAVYVNLLLIVPRVLQKKWYLLFALLLSILVALLGLFYHLLFNNLVDYILPGYFFISYFDFWDYALFITGYLILTTLVKLAKGWFRLAEVENEKKSMELQALKSQLHPHFLFNTLNTIYGQSLQGNQKVSGLILSLSDMLRYTLYEADKNEVDTMAEIDFITNFVQLQTKRFETATTKVQFNCPDDFANTKISPLILLPLVENCFKHLGSNARQQSYVMIKIVREAHWLHLKTENTFDEAITDQKGIGIVNTKKRLQLIYDDGFELDYLALDGVFKLCLKISLW